MPRAMSAQVATPSPVWVGERAIRNGVANFFGWVWAVQGNSPGDWWARAVLDFAARFHREAELEQRLGAVGERLQRRVVS